MTDDAKKLLEYINDCSNGNYEKDIIIDIKNVVEIVDVERKCERLFEILKQERYIQDFKIEGKHIIAVKLTAKSGSYPEKEWQSNKDWESRDDKKRNGVDKIHDDVMEKFIKKRVSNLKIEQKTFDSYSELFDFFIKVRNDDSEEQNVDNFFEFIVDKVHQTDNENYIKILGPDGTGKSTFLSILYLYLYECYCKGKLQEYPYYINLHYYDRNVVEIDHLDELNRAIKNRIKEDLNDLLKFSEKDSDTNFLIIIDGNDKYDRTHLKSVRYLENILKEIKGHKKIICLGEKTNIHNYREINSNLYIDHVTSFTFHFSPIYINEREKWKNVIEKFCEIFNSSKQVKKICECIDKFNIKEIDFNLLTIFCDVAKNTKLTDIVSISNLYFKYCMDYLEKDEDRLKTSVRLSYEYFMTMNYIEQSLISSNWKEWELVHQHKAISNYLLALHYSELIFEGKEENFSQFQCVFTNGINIFLKSIINESVNQQKRAIKFCKILFQKGDFRAQAQAAYLLGRIRDIDLQDEAKEILNEQLECWEQRYKLIRKSQNKKQNGRQNKRRQDEREQCFVKRSLLVSLLNLNDSTAGKRLLKNLLEIPLMNEVNRGFYLQYYEDVPQRQPETVNLKDEEKNKITHTASVLFNYVNTQFRKKKSDWKITECYSFQIHLFTLCSLIQVRLNEKQYSVEKRELFSILSRTIVELENNLEDEMLVYISMLCEDIEKKVSDIGHLYKELYGLKDIQRKGWVKKIKKGSIQVDRYENVVEHTYYAWLLGMLYLPDEKPAGKDYEDYDKKKILNYLLIHDLAEAYTEDHLPEEITVAIKTAEKECMRKIFMHSTYSGIGNMNFYKKIWKEAELNSRGCNGKIAKDLDIIQAIYQFCVYKRMGAVFTEQKEKEWRKEINRIKTIPGTEILKIVLEEFKDILQE